MCGRILDKYKQLGGPSGFLGSPTSNELTNPNNTGKRTSFANDSSIYWSSSTDAHQIGGLIGKRWGELGYEGGSLGYPVTDETGTPDGKGRYNQFGTGGAIYYTAATGAWEIPRKQFDVWASGNFEKGVLGYPVGSPSNSNNSAAARSRKTSPPTTQGPVSSPPPAEPNQVQPRAATDPDDPLSVESEQRYQGGYIMIAGSDGLILSYQPS